MSDKFNYPRYLASREWAERKEAIRKRSSGNCERCGLGPYESTHHVTYANIGHEPLEDLLAVCNPCHEFLSAKSNQDPVKRIALGVIAVNLDWLKDNMSQFAAGLKAAQCRLVGGVDDTSHVQWAESIEDSEFVKQLKRNDQAGFE